MFYKQRVVAVFRGRIDSAVGIQTVYRSFHVDGEVTNALLYLTQIGALFGFQNVTFVIHQYTWEC